MIAKALLLFVCLSGILMPLSAQKKAVIKIQHADFYKPEPEQKRNKLIGNVRLTQDNMLMSCDSLYQYSDSNYVEAFGHVHAIQNDSLHLWGDYMIYDGNTQLAKVRRNVTMKDPKITLTTQFLDYDAQRKVGYYFNTGTLKDSINTLISDVGYYYTTSKEMFFKDNVKVYTPEYEMFSDTLKYNTDSKIILITGPTTIYGENRTLYSEDGWYNTLTSHAELYKNNTLTYNEYLAKADTITVDSLTGTAIMKNNLHLYDTVNNIIVGGNYGEVLKNNDYAFVTDRALLTLVGKQDSLFIHGDTLSVSKDTAGQNVMRAYYHTKFYSRDLQGLCDSMVFPVADSTVHLIGSPIVWASGNQMTSTNIDMLLANNVIKEFHLLEKSMIINQIDSVKYNQIKGRNMIGHLQNNELHLVDVNGNGETLYYPDDKGAIIGMNKATGAYIKIYISERRVKDIIFIQKPEGSMSPLLLVNPEETRLRDFQWHIEKKPLNKEAIFLK
ncbi:OstA-like protein [Odoribacter lunatus]|uniref:OstA-like protein n=1 Tax=Odoribacter lunatus TaxID=2941335 RepID=UPI00204139B8|nr:OstA-like protein [Odoribacter lunatus]